MDILGVGGWELVAILLIMLVVAGPKRMISWSYTLGKYVAQLRHMWAETAEMLQKEFDEAGVDVRVPKDIPTRATLNQEIGRALTPVTKPFQELLDATKREIQSTQKAVTSATKFDLAPTDTSTPSTPTYYPPPRPEATPAPAANPESTAKTEPAAQPETPAAESAPVAPPEAPATAASSNGRPKYGTWSQPDDKTDEA